MKLMEANFDMPDEESLNLAERMLTKAEMDAVVLYAVELRRRQKRVKASLGANQEMPTVGADAC